MKKEKSSKKKESDEKPSKKQIVSQNKILKKILIWIGIFVGVFVVVSLGIYSMNHFEHRGAKFDVDKVSLAEHTLYKTSLPVAYRNNITGELVSADYNFYIRNDPRELDREIPFEVFKESEAIVFTQDLVINMTEDFACEGDGIIGIQNLKNLYELLGTKVIKNPEIGCDAFGESYLFLQIRPGEGEETSIEQFAPTCYNVYVNDCEILKVTERMMVEIFAKVNEDDFSFGARYKLTG